MKVLKSLRPCWLHIVHSETWLHSRTFIWNFRDVVTLLGRSFVVTHILGCQGQTMSQKALLSVSCLFSTSIVRLFYNHSRNLLHQDVKPIKTSVILWLFLVCFTFFSLYTFNLVGLNKGIWSIKEMNHLSD